MNNFWNFQENLPNNKSNICRICAKESEYGQKLFNSNSEIQRIAVQICAFISIKLEKIQIYPNWICSGCQLQFHATYHFFQIIRNSQNKLAEQLALSQKPQRKPKSKRIHIYTVDADQVDGTSCDNNFKVGDKRIPKTPKRFKDSMQGNELEDLYSQIGITKRKTRQSKIEKTETIAHIEDQDGFRLGEMISIVQESNRTNTRYQCDFCKKYFVREIAFYNHLSFHTNILYECNECKAVFQSKAIFNGHVKKTNHIGLCIIETPRLKTQSRDIQDNTIAELPQEEETNKKEEIEIEKYETPSEGNQVDIITELPEEDDIIAELPQENDIIAELPQEGDIVAELPQEEEANKKEIIQMKKFVCLKCPKKFYTKMSVLRHQNTHSDSRPFQCDICLAKFKRKFSLHIHKTTHTKDRPFKCHKCPKRFTIGRSLQLHLRIHDGLKPYLCPICKKSFIQESNLKIHKRIHTGDRPYVCLRCGSSFKTSSQCHLHQKTHTTEENLVIKKKVPGKKNIECKICGRLFAQRSNLRKHIRIHTGDKPYACNLCPQRFSDSSNFQKHKQNHLKEKKSKSKFKSNPNSLLKSNSTEVSSTNPDPGPDGLIAATAPASNSFTILEDIALPNVNNSLLGMMDEDDDGKNLNKWNSDVIVTDIPNDENAIVQQQKQQEMLMNQLVCISYQDPMNPVGNKTTFYVVNQGN